MTRIYQHATAEQRMEIRNDVFKDFLRRIGFKDPDPWQISDDGPHTAMHPDFEWEPPDFPEGVRIAVAKHLRKTLDDEMPLIPDDDEYTSDLTGYV